MAKSYISKQNLREFVYQISEEKLDALHKEKIAALEEALSNREEFKKFKEALSSALTFAEALSNAGFGDAFIDMLPSMGALIGRLNSRCQVLYDDPGENWATICAVVRPYEEQIYEIHHTRNAAYRFINASQSGRDAADKLKEAGLDYYEHEIGNATEVPDLSALKGGD